MNHKRIRGPIHSRLGAVKRSTFKELAEKDNKRFDYAFISGKRPNFKSATRGSIQHITLFNLSTRAIERLTFKVSHNEFFTLTGQRYVYGLVQTEDGRYVQIEFNLYKKGSDFDDRIVAYLRTPPVRRYSPSNC